MANVIKLKNSGTANSAPTSLEVGELAINYADGKIFYKDTSNAVVEFTGPSGLIISNTAPAVTDILWADTSVTGVGVVPVGGTTGQMLAKSSSADYDAAWATPVTSSDLALKAPLASPALTGTPTSPTAAVGTNTTQLATTEFVTTAASNVTSGFRNVIINGDMRIAQRGTATITGSGSAQYPVDRWAVYNGTGTVTFVQSTDAPAGFNASILATVTATGSYSTAGYTQITHKIEGFNCQDLAYGTASAKTITLSFWVKSSVVGIQNVSFKNSGNNRVYVATYTIDVANTWEKKTTTVVGDTTGTWLVDSGIGLEVTFNLGMGTQYDATAGSWQALAARYSTSDAIDFAANSGATLRVTGVQLEVGSVATPFEQRPIGVELALCQRYFWKLISAGISYLSFQYAGTQYRLTIPHPVQMRIAPHTVTSSTWQGGTVPSLGAASVLSTNWSTTGGWYYVDSSTSIEISAEL
jgi:hypothetical protein